MSPTRSDYQIATTAPGSAPPPTAAPPSGLPPALGGPRALIDGAAPALIFVVVQAVVGAQTARPTALWAAIGAATATGLWLVTLRLAQSEPLRQALGGLAGLTIAVLFAATSGEARGFFLPGILVDATYGLVFAGSAFVGYPLVGAIYGLLYRRRDWRDVPRLRRLFVLATFGWSGVFAIRAGVQALLYREDLPELLAVSKLVLGWPLTIVAAALTLAAVRRASAAKTHGHSTPSPVRKRAAGSERAPSPEMSFGAGVTG